MENSQIEAAQRETDAMCEDKQPVYAATDFDVLEALHVSDLCDAPAEYAGLCDNVGCIDVFALVKGATKAEQDGNSTYANYCYARIGKLITDNIIAEARRVQEQ